MPNLIQCILQNHADLEHAALSLYEERAQHVVADAAQMHVTPICKALYLPLLDQLTMTNLDVLDKKTYSKLTHKISALRLNESRLQTYECNEATKAANAAASKEFNWESDSLNVKETMCATVLQALSNALEIARRKQQIAKSIVECELYLKDLGPRILKAVYEARLPFTLDGFISSESLSKKELLARKPILNSQYLQYKMADKLRLTLVNNNSDEQKIEDFTTKFKKYRVRLENSKDPRALRFTKIICAIFAIAALGIGLFFASRITASKGGNVASRLQKILR